MNRALFVVLGAMLLVPHVQAADTISRRDGFLLLWESIQRPAFETREKPFADVAEGEKGFLEITYAKNRGILDDHTDHFLPDEPLGRGEALLWLFRTRNVDDLEEMNYDTLLQLIDRYPVVKIPGSEPTIGPMTEAELVSVMQALDIALKEEDHEVSLYSEKFHGDGTAFGETFDMHALTAAHRTFPHNTVVKVTNVENEKSVTVRINDRGPYVEGRDMDLSLAAFTTIAERSKGVIRARFERLGDAALISGCPSPTAEEEPPRFQKRIARNVRFHQGVPHRLDVGEELTLAANKWFVVRGMTYPDGSFTRMQDWVSPEEQFRFAPSVPGAYVFLFSTAEGQEREMHMEAVECREEAPSPT